MYAKVIAQFKYNLDWYKLSDFEFRAEYFFRISSKYALDYLSSELIIYEKLFIHSFNFFIF